MTLEAFQQSLAVALFAGPLLVAAWLDLSYFRIPNILTGIHAALFPVAAIVSPVSVDWFGSVAACGIFLAGGFGLFSLRLLGGGDAKLLASAALWLGLWNSPLFLVLVAVLGGFWTALLLIARRAARAVLAYVKFPMPRVLSEQKAIPYGVPIAAAALTLVAYLPLLPTGA